MVEDLSSASLRILGERLDLDPEFFAKYLHNAHNLPQDPRRFYANDRFRVNHSDYVFPREGIPSSQSEDNPEQWDTSGMRKSYRIISWYRYVVLLAQGDSLWYLYNGLPDDRSGILWPFRRLHDLPTCKNDSKDTERAALSEERIAICETDVGHCHVSRLIQYFSSTVQHLTCVLVIILCDPVPYLYRQYTAIFKEFRSRGSWNSELNATAISYNKRTGDGPEDTFGILNTWI